MAGELTEGTKVAGRYVIRRLLGRGGMGAVYEAQHEELGRLVALKVLLPKFAADAELVARFFREARTAAAIKHPGIVDVFDLGRDGDLAFIAMERLEGEELTDRIRLGGKLGPRFVAQVGVEVAEALAAAHDRGVIHRDVKPQNVFLAAHRRDQEVVKILDFGIAKLAEAEPTEPQLTHTGQIFGTPLYMAPEQAHARKDLDARLDIYAVGAVLYEALAARPAFEADSYPSLLIKIVSETPRPLGELRADVPPALVAVIDRAMAKDRDHRYPTAHALAEALQQVVAALPDDPPPEPRQPPSVTEGGLDETAPRGTPEPRQRSLASLSARPAATPAPLNPALATPQLPAAPVAVTPAPAARSGASELPSAPSRSRAGLLVGVGLAAITAAGIMLWPRALPTPEVPPAQPLDAGVVSEQPPAPKEPDKEAVPKEAEKENGTQPGKVEEPVKPLRPTVKKKVEPEPQPELLPR